MRRIPIYNEIKDEREVNQVEGSGEGGKRGRRLGLYDDNESNLDLVGIMTV